MSKSTVIPCLRYRDAAAAIEWLVSAFGFEKNFVVSDDKGGIAHAQLCLGGGMIMLGTVADTPFGRHVKQPDEIGGMETQSAYVLVGNADEVHARVLALGGKIIVAIKDEDYGGRGFTCLDLEGHMWSVGSYDPWAATPHRA